MADKRRSKPQRGDTTPLRVQVEKLAVGGAGLARHEGLVIFIPQAAPGDELLVERTVIKKNYAEAKILEILRPGPSRRRPPCPVAERCGGCNWQHLTEAEQQKQKSLFVQETLQKFLREISFDFLPLQPSPKALRYRNRIQPKIKNGNFGFYERETHDVVDILDCPITEEALAQKIPEVRAWALQQRSSGRLEMYLTEENLVRFGFVDESDEGIGFSQVNRFQNQDLVRTCLEWASGFRYKNIYDLYAGSGNFSFPLASQFNCPLTAVELSEKLVRRGKALVQKKMSPVHFVQSDVESWLKKAQIQHDDLVILDPPRAGCSEEIMMALARSQPRKIIYISCHPVSLARDLKWFFDWSKKQNRPHLSLRRVQSFEMFPQTDHVETIAELGVDS